MKPSFSKKDPLDLFRVSTALIPLILLAPLASANEGLTHALPGGIVFPGFSYATASNPAGLTSEHATVAQALFGPPIWGTSSTTYGANLATGSSNFGLGLSVGQVSLAGTNTTSWNAGGAFKAQNVSLGAEVGSSSGTYSTYGTSAPLNYTFGLGIGHGDGVNGAVVFTDTSGSTTQVSLGIGYGENKKYNLEADLSLPPFSNLFSGATYGLNIAAAVYAGAFGVSYSAISTYLVGGGSTSGSASSFSLNHSFGAMFKPFKSSFFSVTFISSGLQSFGYSLVF